MSQEHLCVAAVPLFQHLDLEDQRIINRLVKHHIFQKGEQIITPDENPQLVVIAQGNMKVYQLSATGREQLLRVVGPNGYEGEGLLLGAQNENLFGEAMQKTEVCLLKQEDFQKILLQYPQISLKLLEINAQKLMEAEQQAQFLMMEKVENRLMTYLLDLYKTAGSKQVEIPMKMKELASFLGTTPETLSRKLKWLEGERLIQRKGSMIKLLDKKELENRLL
ncbi:Crp/Fnr family transcriptional regulator [Oceanobacillus oncorhynchi subsp. incaldanensis]|uniref:Crp/Fnr family transcriptional regulator n=1 Tax=Oceanobacillus aidingensis TaxID=645964 RepID=A0ABV9JZX1_9BACI|nr:Crp/Fnr family transcriptional regulator [Oceanobacillus oncorhynchi]MDM8098547.1 Crp/Fnr family transcriptional regulator [Oceanobacillus oncorhynchi]UUI39005.1 Crp/Fnr family transcriptional regulator [Oceanobacillus oncorhynchi]GIO19204.1 Crp/Fnr family transcriptional regulator [Oceanobacillus oncorhynchi subsp. incaldanensis]